MIANNALIQEINNRKEEIVNDGYHQTILNIMYSYYVTKSYKENLDWFEQKFGTLAKFAVLIGKYNQQVCNGGHFQYYNNGYCDGIGGCLNEHDSHIPLHKELIELFNQSDLKDAVSLQVLKILESLHIELDEEEYIEEEIEDDYGEIEINESENPDYLEVINTSHLNHLDQLYYTYNEQFMEILEKYFKDKTTIKE